MRVIAAVMARDLRDRWHEFPRSSARVLSGALEDAVSGATLVAEVTRTTNPWERMRGLLGRTALAPGEGLLLTACASVHTWFMRFAIDVVYLDRSGTVVRVVPALPPWRMSLETRAAATLELAAGGAAAAGLAVGTKTVWRARQ